MSTQQSSNAFSTQAQRSTGKLLATQGYVVGAAISGDGTRQAVALADLNGTILQRARRPLEDVPDVQTLLKLLDELLAEVMAPELLQNGRVLRVGVAVNGLVDSSSGIVRTLHHMQGWENFPLQDYLSERLEIPCIVDTSANAAALAEALYGAGVGERLVLYVGLGRGIGGGMVVNGNIYHGATCTAGEIGHLLVKEEGPSCSCGAAGHLEAIASSGAITQAMLLQAEAEPETLVALRRVTAGEPSILSAEQVFRLAAEGDAVARRVCEEVERSLGIALANIVHLVNPALIILGGSMAQAGELLLEPLRAQVNARCLPAATQHLRIVQSALGSEASTLGAVTLALQDI